MNPGDKRTGGYRRTAAYLAFITLGLALMATSIGWLSQWGCAILLSTLVITGRFSRGSAFMTGIGWIVVGIGLVNGGWQFKAAFQHGHLWRRFPPNGWWIAWLLFAWISNVVAELRRLTSSARESGR